MRYHPSLRLLCEEGQQTLGQMFAERQHRALGNPPVGTPFPYTGIEIEVENAPPTEWLDTEPWRTTADGSLRNYGMELLSSPIRTPATLRRYCNKYTELRHGRAWQDSIRTSTHVHLDARQLQLPHLVKIIAAYNLIEPFLYQYCGPAREENIYCIPFYRADTLTEELVESLQSGRLHQLLRNTCKYSGFYIGPVCTYGTIEFRMAPSFPTGDGVMAWVLMLHHFYNAALAMDPATAYTLLDRGQYAPLLQQLLPAALYPTNLPPGSVSDLLEEHMCDSRAMMLYELFMPPREKVWVLPEMPRVASCPNYASRQRLVGLRERMDVEEEDEDGWGPEDGEEDRL